MSLLTWTACRPCWSFLVWFGWLAGLWLGGGLGLGGWLVGGCSLVGLFCLTSPPELFPADPLPTPPSLLLPLCREGALVTQLASGSPPSTTGGRGGACGPRRLHNRLSGRSAAQPFWTVAATQRFLPVGFFHAWLGDFH